MRDKRSRHRRALPAAAGQNAAALTSHLPTVTPSDSPSRTSEHGEPIQRASVSLSHIRGWLWHRDWTFWLLIAVALVSLVPRLYGLNWDANNHLHPDERAIIFKSICLSLPGTPRGAGCDPAYTGPGWFLSPASPLNPHFFAYGSFPMYLLAAVAHGLAWVTKLTSGAFHPPDGGAWDDFNHFTLVGRTLSALFDTGSVFLAGLLTRRLAGPRIALLAAAFVAVIPFEVQVAHFYAVDTLLLFFVLLALLGCLSLADGRAAPHFHETATDSTTTGNGAWMPRFVWRAWSVGIFVGVAFGLAMATKVSALPLLVPIAVALALRWRRGGFDEAALAAVGIASAAFITFLVTSPYTLLDWSSFNAQVMEQTNLSRGLLDYPYVRQFTGTTQYVYEIQQLLLYDMGLPLGLLGLAGFGWAVSRVWRRLDDDWSILVIWLLAYFAVVGSAYTKFTRYMLPVFVPLAICGAAMLAALAAWGVRRIGFATSTTAPSSRHSEEAHERSGIQWVGRTVFALPIARRLTGIYGASWWRTLCGGLGAVVLAISLFLTVALVHIYSLPNTRVQASQWIYNHVPAGATLTNEVWDDPLPVLVPAARTDASGTGYTAAGHTIDPGQYTQVGLNLYDADTQDKAAQLASQLASANVVVISSQRLVRSIPKLPDRYPMTTRYYDLLFSSNLGFHLAAHFENHPNLFGFTLNDTGADESFSVYDHPPVWIFVRTGSGLSASQILARLTNGVSLPATANRSGAQKSLLLPSADQKADMQSRPIGVQFPANSLPNSIPVIWWLFVIELLGLITFPLTYSVFPGLRDRGWGLSKLLGILALALLTWLPASLRILPFDQGVVVAAFLLLAVAGGIAGWRRRAALGEFARARWKLLVVCEVAFLIAFLYFTWIRAIDPDLWHIYRGGEKPMEFAFLNAILRSRYMPPFDPWFSGGYINYYYYGQYLFAMLIKLTGISPAVAFNLSIPLLFGLTFSGAYSIVGGLIGKWWAGLAGGIGVVVVCNLDGVAQLAGQWKAILAQLPIPPFDYWQSSRVIPYTINEFPYWSFLYADLHAHLIDLPIVVLMIAGCASLVASARSQKRRWLPAIPTLAALALALGAAWCTSTWDLPTYAVLIALAAALRVLPPGDGAAAPTGGVRSLLTWPRVRGYALALGATYGASYVLYLPFHAQFQNFVSGVGASPASTDPNQFATLFGLWLFLLATFFVVELRDRIERRLAAQALKPEGHATRRLWITVAASAVALLFAYTAGLKVLLVVLLAVGLYLALDRAHSPLKLFTYTLLLLGLAIALGVEFVYIRDFLDNSPFERMNTIFKFYYQVWTLFSLGGVLAFCQLLPRVFGSATVSESSRSLTGTGDLEIRDPQWSLSTNGVGILRTVWTIVLVVLVLGSSIFLVEGTQVRLQDPTVWAAIQPPPGGVQPRGLSLDGMAFMRGWYPGDYAAINWLNTHVGGDPTIVEATNGNYQWYSRVSVYTGLPDVLGWGNREYEQRYGDEVFARQADVVNFWSTTDSGTALGFLRQYNVRYIYVGNLERTCYIMQNNTCVPMSAGALAKFQTLQHAGAISTVYSNSDVVIYEVNG